MSTSATEGLEAYLEPTYFIDSDHPDVVAFARDRAGDAPDARSRAVRLFYAVRDGLRYDPYAITFAPEDYRASAILARGRGYCVHKAVVLAAVARAVGIPSRLAFADVRNHLTTPRLRSLMKSDVFVFHGLTQLFLDGRWVKATPTFDIELCRRFGVRPLDFDGRADAVLHPFDAEGRRHMEYLRDRGHFADLPLETLEAAFHEAYPHFFAAASPAAPQGDFAREASESLPSREDDD